ncbi:hypothetical protein ACFP1I_23400 [Dyadobacter subterraneus]|uniref:Uncharacterized protein n=1 Tax=Dyadobacter subterraneus TaxID=2773304 RepID=A0ABR9W8Z5_9BACT|nr:hypothetical protein [Dyadobacter subterraneus]MBE9461935.1 hypothetical protein [Dyadobacter subterraneus]
MEKILTKYIIFFAAISMISCEKNYRLEANNRLTQKSYIATKTYNTNTKVSTDLTSNIKQNLTFGSADTLKVIRNDSVVMQLTNYGFVEWIGNEKDGKALYSGINSEGKWFVLFTIDFDEPKTSPITAGVFMQNEYRPNADTLWTYYVPGL